jgi:hypothetical protein
MLRRVDQNPSSTHEQNTQVPISDLNDRIESISINGITCEQRYSKTKIACTCVVILTGAATLYLAYKLHELHEVAQTLLAIQGISRHHFP